MTIDRLALTYYRMRVSDLGKKYQGMWFGINAPNIMKIVVYT